jgi:poly(3-hydroxyalkanoate) synthetase
MLPILNFFYDWQKACLRFWEEWFKSFCYDPPHWDLECEEVYETPGLKLLRFQEGEGAPILVVPPNAGHHSNIAEKLISYTMKESSRPVYTIEWLSSSFLNKEGKNYSIESMVWEIRSCVDEIGGPVHFFSLCQGAWATAICICCFRDSALSYTNAAGPINFKSSDGKIDLYTEMLPMMFFHSMVGISGGIQNGHFQILGFKNLNPYERWIGDYVELFFSCWNQDEEKIKKWHRFKRWYEYPIHLGKWYLEAVQKLFKENSLIKGELEVLEEKIDLSNIQCPVFLVAGGEDDITRPQQVFDLERTTPITEKFLIRDVGHIGVFVSKKSEWAWKEVLGHLDRADALEENPQAA